MLFAPSQPEGFGAVSFWDLNIGAVNILMQDLC